MQVKIPELSLVLLIGTSGAGKSTFAKKHFKSTEIVSSDICRGIVSDDENSLNANKDAFELLDFIIRKRLKNGLLTVVDATNVQKSARRNLIALAREFHCLPVAIVLNTPPKIAKERNKLRSDRAEMGNHVIRQQHSQLKDAFRSLKREGFRRIYRFDSVEEIEAVTGIEREKLYNNKKEEHGPFDIIGDIHGCFDELLELLEKMDYVVERIATDNTNFGFKVSHPENRQVIFLGDLVDRGPNSPDVLRLAMSMLNDGVAICVPGNHDLKLQKKLSGKNVSLQHGLAETMEQLEKETDEFKEIVREFLYSLISHYVLDDGKLVVAHAGIREEMQGRGSGVVRSFCLYGETTGEIDEFGLPVRYDWASEYRGYAKVVYGHTPVPEAEWFNRTIDIDTGCVFGGKLTALRYPEEILVSVPAHKVYCEPAKPLIKEGMETSLSNQQVYDDLLNIEDVIGKRIVQTRLRNNITIKEENSIAALEVMSRFAINPKWLIYLPPTMSPCETSELPDYLEHPKEAIDYYRNKGIAQIVCEEKHMGSRAVVIVCKDEETVAEKFGIVNEGIGVCYTRTGRNFFNDANLEQRFLETVRDELTKGNFWEKFETSWVCLDTELMPWSAKAQSLLKDQYASVGAAASNALPAVVRALEQTQARGIGGVEAYVEKFANKQASIGQYIKAYQQYCWEVKDLSDFRLAPFHILATEGAVHSDKTHQWHIENIGAICEASSQLFYATPYKIVDCADDASVEAVIQWWLELTEKGGEGMVIKPMDFVAYGKRGLLQPAIKCRGKEYLRIIYGPEYDTPEHLKRLKKRGLLRKRSLALREFALGIEGLERFVGKQPLRRTHESVFGVLALESEAVDPRL